MFSLALVFRSNDTHHILSLTNTVRESAQMNGDVQFALTTDSCEAHVFYCHEDLLSVIEDIKRVLNRRGPPGEDFDESMEHTKEVVRTIRTYLNMRGSRFSVEFDLQEVVPRSMGKIAIAIRSDALR